mgnify:CR=1 FL=1
MKTSEHPHLPDLSGEPHDLALWKQRLQPLPRHRFSPDFDRQVLEQIARVIQPPPLLLSLQKSFRPALLLAASLVLLLLGILWQTPSAASRSGSTDLGADQDLALMLSWEESS